jgi:hypothetical protein
VFLGDSQYQEYESDIVNIILSPAITEVPTVSNSPTRTPTASHTPTRTSTVTPSPTNHTSTSYQATKPFSSPSPASSVPELSWLEILPLFALVLCVALAIKQHNRQST